MAEQLTVELLGLHHMVDAHPQLAEAVRQRAEALGWELAGCAWRPSGDPLCELSKRQLAALSRGVSPAATLVQAARAFLLEHGCSWVLSILPLVDVVDVNPTGGAAS